MAIQSNVNRELRMGIDSFAQPSITHAARKRHVRLGWLCIFILGAVWLEAWFYGLASRALSEPDEGRYAEVAREMLVSRDWITPRLNGFNFFDKPPLHYWATAGAYLAFGISPGSARLWCALTGLLAIVAMGWAGARLFGRETGGYIMAILGSSLLFAFGSHINTLDMGVTAFLATGIACFMVAQFDPTAVRYRHWLNAAMWFALALAVLSKGLIGVVLPGVTLIVYMAWQRDLGVLSRLSLLVGAAIFFATCVPWFVAICRIHPDFFDYFFIKEHFTRFLTSVDQRDKPMWFFLPVVAIGMLPWTILLPWTKRDWLAIHPHEPAKRFALAWIGVVFVFFSVSHSKLPFYILPLFPALAFLVAQLVAALPSDALRRRLWIIAVVAGLCACATLVVASTKHLNVSADVAHQALRGVSWSFALIALAALFGTFVHGRYRYVSVYTLAFASLIGWQLTLKSFQTFADMDSAEPVARLITPELGPHTEVYIVHRYLRGLPFYLGRLTTVVEHQDDDMTPALASRPDGYISDFATFEHTWRAGSDAVALVPDSDISRLQTDQMPFRVIGRIQESTVISRDEFRSIKPAPKSP